MTGAQLSVYEGAAFEQYAVEVPAAWIDYNGHMTDSAYAVACTAANEVFLDALDLGAAYLGATGRAVFTVECHLRYLAQVSSGSRLRARTVLVDHDAKRLLVHTSLVAANGAEVLTGEYLYLHVDQATGRTTPFPSGHFALIVRVQTAHDVSLPLPHVGRGVWAGRSR